MKKNKLDGVAFFEKNKKVSKRYRKRKKKNYLSEEEIIAEASKHLASYQKPKSVDFVDALPKAPTGKILKRDLRDPYWQDETRQV